MNRLQAFISSFLEQFCHAKQLAVISVMTILPVTMSWKTEQPDKQERAMSLKHVLLSALSLHVELTSNIMREPTTPGCVCDPLMDNSLHLAGVRKKMYRK